MTNRTRVVIATAGAGALAVGGFVAKKVLGHGGDEDRASADPIAETPTAPPGAEEKPVPKPKPAKPKAAPGPKADKPKPAKPKAAPKPKPAAKPKAAKPPKTTGGKDPHQALNNPVVDDPDLTEYPDPYDTREDPLADPDHPTGAGSTSEPPLQQDPEVENGGKPPRRENLDD